MIPARAAEFRDCPRGTTDPNYCQISEEPTATVAMSKAVRIIVRRGRLPIIDTGSTVSCLPHMPASCGGSVIVTADVANASRLVTLARRGFRVRSGSSARIRARVTSRAARRALRRLGGHRLRLHITITTRGLRGRRTPKRRAATVRVPR